MAQGERTPNVQALNGNAPLFAGPSFAPIFLPVPIGGFPAIHRSDPDAIRRNIDPRQLAVWESFPQSTSAAIQVFGRGYPRTDEAKSDTDTIREVLVELTGCPDVEVAAPIAVDSPITGGSAAFPGPVTYFARNLTEAAAAHLKTHTYWSTGKLSLFAYGLSPVIPDLLFTLRGFTTTDDKLLHDTIRDTMFSPTTRLFTLSFALTNPRFHEYSYERIIVTLMHSFRIHVISDSSPGAAYVNVYCSSPTTSPDTWRLWRDGLRTLKYWHGFGGVGKPAPSWEYVCRDCHGDDHTWCHCPFNTLMGWNLSRALVDL
ncbi:hypothetical protein C8Q79DRAFT_923151 [Trametes meyenii]|nr:hypothetical protein C8Q79DRAFT_923149 [Trametes meyenii]KAI0649611.1 hypothetical protein C8Q79DRAFT_923151 [Trametes meyenii]